MKVFKILIVLTLFLIFSVQASQVLAKHGDDDKPLTGPITNPITSPITSPCKPGWGFGDKNHCHFGPPGQINKDLDDFFSKTFKHFFEDFDSLFHIHFK